MADIPREPGMERPDKEEPSYAATVFGNTFADIRFLSSTDASQEKSYWDAVDRDALTFDHSGQEVEVPFTEGPLPNSDDRLSKYDTIYFGGIHNDASIGSYAALTVRSEDQAVEAKVPLNGSVHAGGGEWFVTDIRTKDRDMVTLVREGVTFDHENQRVTINPHIDYGGFRWWKY